MKDIDISSCKISVVVPAYQSARTIRTCLDSILAQSLPAHQIVVVDDHSADDTIEQIHHWNSRHENQANLIALSQNGGPAAARNAGIHAATGAWIAFLDADDAWLPWHLETQATVLQENPAAIFICAQTTDLDISHSDAANVSRKPIPEPQRLTLREMLAHNPVATSTVLVRREVVTACGGFDTQFRGPEDYDLWLRIVAAGPSLFLPAIVSRYRTTVGSLSMDERTFLPEVLRVLDKAFSPQGVLFPYRHERHRAKAEQCTAASWMAYNRGDRKQAIRLLCKSWCCGPVRIAKEKQDALQRIKLLIRYLT
ncbi:MAG: glycosyltransferase family 2 protein [Kiritimatiellia bacterium]